MEQRSLRWLGLLVLQVGGVGPLSKPLALAAQVLPLAFVFVVDVCHTLELHISLQSDDTSCMKINCKMGLRGGFCLPTRGI